MKKWYFSDNGQVSGPHSLEDSSDLLSKGEDMYGWNPSFSHWLPVQEIAELKSFVPQSLPKPQISDELINRFVKKKRDLNKKVKLIDEAIKVTKDNLVGLDRVVEKYIQLTDSLSEEVKANIYPIEKKKSLLAKQLTELSKALSIAKSEIVEVVKEFGELVLHNNSSDFDGILDLDGLSEIKPIPKETKVDQANLKKAINIEADLGKPSKKASVSKITPKKEVTKRQIIKSDTEKSQLDIKSETKKTDTRPEADNELAKNIDNKTKDSKNNLFTLPELFSIEKPAYSGVKSKIKSVFKAKDEQPAMRLSDRLKEIDSQPTKVTELPNSIDDHEDSEQKKKRRRRRR